MPQYAPLIRHGTNLAKAAKFAGNPTVSGGMSLAQAAIPYVTDSQTAQHAVSGLATGQKVYGALSGGLNKPVSIGGTSLGMTGGQLSGGIGLLSTGFNMSQGMTDPEAVGLQALGSVLMVTGNPYLMAAGAVMQFVGPMLQDEEKIGANVTGKGTAKWGDNGLQAPSIYSNSSILNQNREKGKDALRGSTVLDRLEQDRPTWEQLGLKGPEEMTSGTFDNLISKKQAELDAAKEQMDNVGNGYVGEADFGTYHREVKRLNQELKDLQGKKSTYEAIAPYGVNTGNGNAYNITDLAQAGPYSSAGGGMNNEFGDAFNKGVGAVTQAAVGKFNSEVEAVLSQMPKDKADAIREQLKNTDFDIDYNKAWKKESVKADKYAEQLPGQFQRLGTNIYDQLWGTVEQEFGVGREDLLPFIQEEQPPPTLAGANGQMAQDGRDPNGPLLQGTFGQRGRASIF